MLVLLLQQQSIFIQPLQVLLDHTQLHGNTCLLMILEQQPLKLIIMELRQVERPQAAIYIMVINDMCL